MFKDVFDEVKKIQSEMNRRFGEVLNDRDYKAVQDYAWNKEFHGMRNPLMDMEETEKEIVVKFEIPGVDKKDIFLNLTSNKAEIKVEKKHEFMIERKGFYKEERVHKGFYRSLVLPVEIIPEKSKAQYENGILTVTMPKSEQKTGGKIEIE